MYVEAAPAANTSNSSHNNRLRMSGALFAPPPKKIVDFRERTTDRMSENKETRKQMGHENF